VSRTENGLFVHASTHYPAHFRPTNQMSSQWGTGTRSMFQRTALVTGGLMILTTICQVSRTVLVHIMSAVVYNA